MTIRRPLAVAAVALLLVTAGCLGAVGFGDESGDDTDENGTEDELPDADELVERSIQAESSVETLHGVQTITWADDDELVSSTHEVWQRGANEYRMELLESDEPEQIDVMVSSGTTTWLYDEADNEAVKTELDIDQAELDALNDDLVDSVYADMSATVDGTDTVADRDVYVVDLAADGSDAMYDDATLWIDQETHYPLKQDSTMSMGAEMTITVEFEEVTFDEPIDDDRFAFEPPADAEVIDADDFTFEQFDEIDDAEAAAPFDLPEPAVPAEYGLEQVSVSENMVGWSASLQYTDESDTFLTVTVAEDESEPILDPDGDPIEVGDTDAILREFGTDMMALEWEDDGLSYTVSGDLEREELVEIALSIVE
ncbi:DUF4367 domain-containing protein [Natronorubrum sp. JWXQ-INN-674]|uniref:DUF4367 domain-containing protein n=1 Tax=Natronorubrum halalkaliphilum TaxID=2691917 RepID=A0A6B0VTH8_9EURY|nr:DUF4367 domain-containing protein [Natronorubrum halalkaliphilum]MXV64196.1 DUF4367 domain-containing protein [Natronorubrum halalkaliphilum]